MFNSKEDPKMAEVSNSTNSISNGTVLKGDIETSGKLRIDGKVIGNIITHSKLVLGKTSHITGDIHAQNADLEGESHGNIRVTETLTLKPSAVIHGDILTNKLIVESGAAFTGSCKMGASNSDLNVSRINAQPEKPELFGQPGKSNPAGPGEHKEQSEKSESAGTTDRKDRPNESDKTSRQENIKAG